MNSYVRGGAVANFAVSDNGVGETLKLYYYEN